MSKGSVHGIGVLMIVFGGVGLTKISLSDHGSFIVFAFMFSVGIGLCLTGYSK